MENTEKKAKSFNPVKKFTSMTDGNMLLAITIFVFFLMYICAIAFLGEGYLLPQTFFDLINLNAYMIILACGLSLVMITGGIDISVGGLTALIGMCCAVNLDINGGNLFSALLIALGIGLAFGIVQGFLIAYLDIQPFIVTLAGMFFARGLTTIVHEQPFDVKNEAFMALKDLRIYIPIGAYNRKGIYIDSYITVGAIIAIAIVILLFVVLKWTKLGRHFYAVGGNPQSALMLGINVKRTRFIAQVICGLLGGIGAFVYLLRVGSGSPSNATGAEMNAIAASIIGGTLLTGGVGNIIGTLFGTLSLCLIQNIVSSAGFDQSWWTGITIALMLCLFLVIQSVVVSLKKKSLTK